MSNTTTANGSTYTTKKFKVGKTEYAVLIVTGKHNYINVRKLTANPFGITGKDFENFDAAVGHYKNRSIKLELTKIELGLS